MITLEQENKVIELRGLQYSYDEIAKASSVSKPKVMAICKQNTSGITARRDAVVQANQELFMASAENRKTMYLKLLEGLATEVLSRNLSEIPTDKIVSLMEKVERTLATIASNDSPTTHGLDKRSDQELLEFIYGT